MPAACIRDFTLAPNGGFAGALTDVAAIGTRGRGHPNATMCNGAGQGIGALARRV